METTIKISKFIGLKSLEVSTMEILILIQTRGVSNCVALPFTLKNILKQKKDYGNSNISL
jgi:hypothetical protein